MNKRKHHTTYRKQSILQPKWDRRQPGQRNNFKALLSFHNLKDDPHVFLGKARQNTSPEHAPDEHVTDGDSDQGTHARAQHPELPAVQVPGRDIQHGVSPHHRQRRQREQKQEHAES